MKQSVLTFIGTVGVLRFAIAFSFSSRISFNNRGYDLLNSRYEVQKGRNGRITQSILSLESQSTCNEENTVIDQLDTPWYSSDELGRLDRPASFFSSNSGQDEDVRFHENKKIVLLSRDEKGRATVYHYRNVHNKRVLPMYLTYDQIKTYHEGVHNTLMECDEKNGDDRLIWIGHDSSDDNNDENQPSESSEYWALDLKDDGNVFDCSSKKGLDDDYSSDDWEIVAWPLREFGDLLESAKDAAILSTGYGLVQFHMTHQFCHSCGSATQSIRSGAARTCKDEKEQNCGIRQYPRINVATIFLITSTCQNYALLGRKAFWPKGRYSTLAGFLDIGETMEQCLIRETMEESGVSVDKNTIEFIASQPWPFPNSFMVGFQAKASETTDFTTTNAGDDDVLKSLPSIHVNADEMEDVKWFHKDYVAARLQGGSTALEEIETLSDKEKEFHIPGKASLARILITKWALNEDSYSI